MSSRQATHYAPDGLIGVLTPQANTTVEPEFAILCPPGFAFVNARMTSVKATITARLADYADKVGTHIEQFSNAPVDSIAFACTGSSYLLGPDAEDALVKGVRQTLDLPLVTTARAVVDALALLNASSIACVSPYPEELTALSARYFRARGIEVELVVNVFEDKGAFHPIYALDGDSATGGLAQLQNTEADAVLLLGTGMPTLHAIAAHIGWRGPPVLSSMLALAWRSVTAASRAEPTRSELEQWLRAEHWLTRLAVAST